MSAIIAILIAIAVYQLVRFLALSFMLWLTWRLIEVAERKQQRDWHQTRARRRAFRVQRRKRLRNGQNVGTNRNDGAHRAHQDNEIGAQPPQSAAQEGPRGSGETVNGRAHLS